MAYYSGCLGFRDNDPPVTKLVVPDTMEWKSAGRDEAELPARLSEICRRFQVLRAAFLFIYDYRHLNRMSMAEQKAQHGPTMLPFISVIISLRYLDEKMISLAQPKQIECLVGGGGWNREWVGWNRRGWNKAN